VTTPGFTAAQAELVRARAASEAAQLAAGQAAERQKAIAGELDLLARSLDRNDDAAVAEQRRLQERAKRAETEVAAALADAQRADADAVAALGTFAIFTDPRQNAGRLSDRSPFALLPVRVETRFVELAGDAAPAPRHQLWVRVYPDDCWIDTFEPTLSTTELANAQRYWRRIWRAGRVEADERAAWRALVTAHGSGRASYIVDTYQPTNLADHPTKAAPADEILVIPTQTPLSAAEATAAVAYWQAIWLAAGDAAKQQAARATLEAAVGAPRAAELDAGYRPFNLSDSPSADVALTTAFLVFPPNPPTKQDAWSQAPKVRRFPERFVVLAYSGGAQVLEAVGGVITVPLDVGPDPSADASHTIHPEGGDLFVPGELKWMVDFESAVEAGMGLEIDLTPQQAESGFDRLLVLGLNLGAGDDDGRVAFEELLRHHAAGRSGLEVLAQGTPTNNTTGANAGHTGRDDADESFDDHRDAPLFAPTNDPMLKRDGQWLAELLGVDPAVFATVHGSGGADQLRARAMQRALWPSTLGYWMDKMLAPVFDDDVVESTRSFFTQYVSGRGAAPAIRIGGQPYGILPTTAFSRIRWLDAPIEPAGRSEPQRAFLARLLALLRTIDADWTTLSGNISFVGKPGDAHQTLLDILGLNASSVEFHSRYAESIDELYNIANLSGGGPSFSQALLAIALQAAGVGLLQRLGYAGAQLPDILQQVFLTEAGQIANVVDDRPLSETSPIRAYTDDGRNYIRWLIDAAGASLDDVVAERGFSGDVSPQTLLYLFLRHALMLGYYDTSYRLHRTAGFLSATELAAMKPEPTFVHVADAQAASESRFAALYKTEPRITSSASVLVSDYITANLANLPDTAGLADQIAALRLLAGASTAQLERVFAEHIDICSYRLDAWLLGIVSLQLQEMRAQQGDLSDVPRARTGVYLGAYAWLEDLRPAPPRGAPIELPPDLQESFGHGSPIVTDPRNGGYIHAPSLQQARTAAVLRGGHIANATPSNPETLAVDLSSERVRLALSLLEGIRNGQSLGALLGYRFERDLHDRHGLAEVDRFIFPLRKAFPLVSDSLSTTKTQPDVAIDAIEARNVLDGRKLVTHIRTAGRATYPFGLDGLRDANDAETAAISAAAEALLDVYDAIADLALAEGVHQAVQGNFDRAGANLDAYTTGNFPPQPEVVDTPPTGIGLTHRVAVHLRPGLSPPPNATPRAQAEPAVDAWLEEILPGLSGIGCTVVWTDPVGGGKQELPVTLADLGVRPIDLLSLVNPDDVQAMTELDDRVLRFAIVTADQRPDADLKIRYLSPPAGALGVFETAALIRSLKTLITQSRPLRATDSKLQIDAAPEQDTNVFVDRDRIAQPKSDLDALAVDVGAFLGTLGPLVADPVANRAPLMSGIDGFAADAVELLERAARFNVPLSGWGFVFGARHTLFADLLAQVRDLISRWDGKLSDFDARIVAYDGLPAGTGDNERLKALRAAELVVSTSLEQLPPATLRPALDVKRTAFAQRRNDLATVLASSGSSFASTLAAVEALLPVTAFDSQPFDVAAFEGRAVTLAEDLARTLSGHAAEVQTRRHAVQAQLDAHDAAGSAAARVQALQAASRALLGEDFQLVPEFALAPAQADELANAVAASGSLLDFLTTTAKIDFPVDEWLYGAARVRPMLHAWETTIMLAEAFDRPGPALTPIQLPFHAGAPWLALQFPPEGAPDSDRLLYTAHYSAPFDKTARQCGLLLDEWTEVIPGTTRTTGIAFNFDRPENEAPQSILLVTPATASGTWQWDDLVGALHATLDLAKNRAVEPVQVDNLAYTRFLPATIMAATLYNISIATALAAANGALWLGGAPDA
jgi:hypothetical protein